MEEIKKIGHAAFRKEALGNHIILHCDLRHCRVSDKLDSETARLYLRAITELADADALLLVDLRDSKGTFSSGGAQILSGSSREKPVILCEAYVVNSLSIRLLVQAYKRIYKNGIPFDMFQTVSAAREYCLSFLK